MGTKSKIELNIRTKSAFFTKVDIYLSRQNSALYSLLFSWVRWSLTIILQFASGSEIQIKKTSKETKISRTRQKRQVATRERERDIEREWRAQGKWCRFQCWWSRITGHAPFRTDSLPTIPRSPRPLSFLGSTSSLNPSPLFGYLSFPHLFALPQPSIVWCLCVLSL